MKDVRRAVFVNILIICSCTSQSVQAQATDSLTARLIAYSDSAKHLRNANQDTKALALLRAVLRSQSTHQSPIGRIQLLHQVGQGELKLSHFQESLDAFTQARRLAVRLRDTVRLSKISYALSTLYIDQGNYNAAVSQCQQTIQYNKRDTSQNEGSYVLLSIIYKQLGNQGLAIAYEKRAIQLKRRSKDPGIRMLAEMSQAELEEDKFNYRQALAFRLKARIIANSLGTKINYDYATNLQWDLARTYRKLGDLGLATKSLNEAVRLENEYHSLSSRAIIYLERASLMTAQGQKKRSTQFAAQAVTFARLSNRASIVLLTLDSLQYFQAWNGQYQAAWITGKEAHQLADSLANVAKLKAVTQTETQFQVAAKENTIHALQQDAIVKRTQAEARQREVSILERQQFVFVGLTMGLIVGISLVDFLLIRRLCLQKQTEQQRQLLENQAGELQALNTISI